MKENLPPVFLKERVTHDNCVAPHGALSSEAVRAVSID